MLEELKCYQIACREFESGEREPETWARALDMAFGVELSAKYLYIHLRVEALTNTAQASVLQPVHRPASPCQLDPAEVASSANAPHEASPASVDEEALLHAIALREVESGRPHPQVWKDALVLAKGDQKSARPHYICLRMDALRAMTGARVSGGSAGA